MQETAISTERATMPKRFHNSDSSMMPSGSGSFSNMPTEVVFKSYPDSDSYLPENLNDKMSGVDAQKSLDNSKKNAHLQPKKV